MKFSDFSSNDFTAHDEVRLSECVIKGDHHPSVKIFHNNKTNETYQVSDKHKVFRKTPPTSDTYLVQRYGDWEKLDS